MSTSLSGLSGNFFPSPQNGFTTTTAGSVASGAATVTLNSVSGYSNGQIATFVIDPTDAAKKQTFTGVVDTSGVQITSVVWTAGTNQTHALGATVVDYATATHIGQMTKGILIAHEQTGIHKSGATYPSPVFSGTVTGTYTLGGTPTISNPTLTGTVNGWVTGLTVPNTVTYNGNRSYDLVVNSTDLTGIVSNGQRLKLTRTVTAPTQCTDLESSSSQYYSKTSPSAMTFTDDFVVSAWVKLESYAVMDIAGRYNGTSGWQFQLNASGQVSLIGRNAGAANFSYVISYQSIPLNKWVHVAAQLDMSSFTATPTTSYIMIDGVDVPASVVRGGTNPTALVQAGDLQIGAANTTEYFDGKLAQVAIYNAKVTQANIRATISQTLSGSETSLISAYSFNNSINDLSANANNLTAQGSAVATNADSPFGLQADGTTAGTTEYAIITKTAFSTNTTITVQVPEGNAIPTSGGVSAVAYSSNGKPYGMPVQEGKWRVSQLIKTDTAVASNATFAALASLQLIVPIGEWDVGYDFNLYNSTTTVVYFNLSSSSIAGLAATAVDSTLQTRSQSAAASLSSIQSHVRRQDSLSSAGTYIIYTLGATTSAGLAGSAALCEISATLATL